MRDTGRLQMKLTSKNALRQYKKQKRVTNAEFARSVGCSESSIAFLLSEKKSSRDTIGFAVAKRIEEFLGVPAEVLFVPEVVVPLASRKVPVVVPVGQRRVVRVPGKRSLVNA